MVKRNFLNKKNKATNVAKVENKLVKAVKQETKEVKQVHKQLKELKIGTRNIQRDTGTTRYLPGLLMPERAYGLKVPGMADSTVSLRRKVTLNLTANALGALGIVFQPNYLSDGSSSTSPIYVNSNSTYDGTTSNGSTAPLANGGWSVSITTGAVAQYRLVSAAMHVIPQTSVLNQAGTIHGALTKVRQQPVTAVASPMSTDVTSSLYPTYQNTPYYSAASISAMEGLRIIWVPNDECMLEFCNINTNLATLDGANQTVNTIVATVVGAAASAPFRVDLYMNYEVIPAVGSILQGMESVCPYDELPTPFWRKVLYQHKDEIVIAGRAISDVHAMNEAKKIVNNSQLLDKSFIEKPEPQYIIGGKKYYVS